MTLREHLVEAAKFDADAARELAGPPLPALARVAWSVFEDLHAARAVSMQGIQPIGYVEIDAYARLTETRLTALDVLLVRVIDESYVNGLAAHMAVDGPATESAQES